METEQIWRERFLVSSSVVSVTTEMQENEFITLEPNGWEGVL